MQNQVLRQEDSSLWPHGTQAAARAGDEIASGEAPRGSVFAAAPPVAVNPYPIFPNFFANLFAVQASLLIPRLFFPAAPVFSLKCCDSSDENRIRPHVGLGFVLKVRHNSEVRRANYFQTTYKAIGSTFQRAHSFFFLRSPEVCHVAEHSGIPGAA
jgi:hypothetical protein